MVDERLGNKLIDYLQDALAMEHTVLRQLDVSILTSRDADLLVELKRHRAQTQTHARRIRERLESFGATVSLRRQMESVVTALMKGGVDMMRGDKPSQNLRDGFVTEHLEIAAYETLERLALRAGDAKTASVARRNRADEVAMARKLGARWDRALELTLSDSGISS
ncbi:MAG: ferritin-like domain-containing protein [Candidatus Dormibacteraeota bacterium]|nr:ferritin-like domain-containing protein [Candidatus Dormibacteraeota bacterium]